MGPICNFLSHDLLNQFFEILISITIQKSLTGVTVDFPQKSPFRGPFRSGGACGAWVHLGDNGKNGISVFHKFFVRIWGLLILAGGFGTGLWAVGCGVDSMKLRNFFDIF